MPICPDNVKPVRHFSMEPDAVRSRVRELIAEKRLDKATISKMMGRSHSYIQQYLERGIPRKLKEDDRASLASILGVSEAELGAPNSTVTTAAGPEVEYRLIPEFDVHVSAGGGAEVAEETEIARWPFNDDYLSNILGLGRAQLAIVEVRGDSMVPTLQSGDRVLVNTSDKQISQAGIFVIFDGGGTVIKRVDKRIGRDDTVTLISDNPIHERYDVPIEILNIVGRVVWVARKL